MQQELLATADAVRRAQREAAGHRERMRDRLLRGGDGAFLDYELLEFVLALAQPRVDTKPVAKALVAEFGSLAAVLAAEPQALVRVRGVGPAGAAALKMVRAAAVASLRDAIVGRPVIAGWQPLIDYLHGAQAHGIHEQVRVLFLNAKNHLIADEVVSDGTLSGAAVHVREVVRRALELGAAAMIVAHNHPSGDPTPSAADVALTRELVAASALFEIVVHDHVVVGHSGAASLRGLGLM